MRRNGAACALGHHDHEMREAVETRRADLFNDLLLEIPALGDENRRRADRKADKQRQMTGVAAMTSTTEQRSCDCIVSRSLSMHSMAVLAAVSKPMQ